MDFGIWIFLERIAFEIIASRGVKCSEMDLLSSGRLGVMYECIV